MAKELHDRPVGTRESETAPIRADPEISVPIFGNRADIGRADCARCRAVWQLPDQPGSRIEHVRAATEGTDPDLAAARFVDRHDGRGAKAARIVHFDRYGLQPAGGAELLDSARHCPDPKRAGVVL